MSTVKINARRGRPIEEVPWMPMPYDRANNDFNGDDKL